VAKVYVDEIPQWIKEISIKEYDHDFIKILDFFQIHSPVPGLSAHCKTLKDYGWEYPWKKPYWLNKQLKQEASNYELLYSAKSKEKMDENLRKADLMNNYPTDLGRERICVVNNKKNQFMSVFYHIRNSLAHGRFFVKKMKKYTVIVMEDVESGSGKRAVTGRMIIRKETLLNWIKLIKNGQKDYIKKD